jgi:hypothetical protein
MHAYGATVTYFALNICKTMWTATQWHYCLHIFLEYPITAHVILLPACPVVKLSLCDLKLYFHNMLITRHFGDFFWNQRKKEYVHRCSQK